MDSCGEYFFFYGLTDFILFLVLAWRNGPFVSEIFFCLLLPGVLGFSSIRHEPCPTTNFFFSFFRWREEGATSVFGVPANHLASIFFPLVGWFLRATRCHPVSHSLSIRSPSTNICFSILTWVCYFGIDPHYYDVLTVILWWLATVNSRTGNSSNLISIFSVWHHVTLTMLSVKQSGIMYHFRNL